MTTRIMYLCKFFTEEEHARSFLSGKIRVQRLSEYRRKEEDTTGRHDPNDGLIRVIPHEGAVVSFYPDDAIYPPIIARPIEPMSRYVDPYVLCMCARTCACVDSLSTDALEQMLRPPADWKELGKWVVLLGKPDIFVTRLKQAASNAECDTFAHDRVNYYTTPPGNDKVSAEEAVFRKEEKFARQSEYRFVFDTARTSSPEAWFEMGNISDIAYLYDVEALFSGTFKITSDR